MYVCLLNTVGKRNLAQSAFHPVANKQIGSIVGASNCVIFVLYISLECGIYSMHDLPYAGAHMLTRSSARTAFYGNHMHDHDVASLALLLYHHDQAWLRLESRADLYPDVQPDVYASPRNNNRVSGNKLRLSPGSCCLHSNYGPNAETQSPPLYVTLSLI